MNIPKTITAAQTKLTELEGIVTASQWERAAIVYAFTEVSEGKVNLRHQHASSSMLSVTEFAKLGIVGLKSKDTVRRYHEAWQSVVDIHAADPVKPGDVFVEPDFDWPPVERDARSSGASVPRVASMLREKKNVDDVIQEMSVKDLFYVINKAQAKVDENKTPRPIKEDGPLDVMVAIVDMADALDRLEKAEPSWSSAIKEGHIDKAVYDEEMGRLDIVHTLMRVAGDSESFEMEVPRT